MTMKFKHTYLIWIFLGLASCQPGAGAEQSEMAASPAEDSVLVVEDVDPIIPLDSIFTEVDSSYTHNTLIVPEGFHVEILFREGLDEVVRADGQKAPAKGSHDMVAFLPDEGNPDKAWLYVSHESRYGDAVLGDGGGGTMFQIQKDSLEQWKRVGEFKHVNFSNVGNTQRNCGGVVGPNGMIYTCEESQPMNNSALTYKGKGHTKTDSVGNLAYWQNFGYVVEVDPKNFRATKKLIAMGRYYHEDLEFMEDGKTVYLSDDHQPGVFFKFVADEAGNYEFGQLYAFRRSEDGNTGSWITLPRDTASMINIRDIAIDSGATLFMRHEWFVRKDNLIYITETGHDQEDWKKYLDKGANIASALLPHTEGTVVKDVFGRILVFNTETNQMSNYLEGGFGADSSKVFSNPDNINLITLGGKEYLLICEDLNGADKGRIPNYAYKAGSYYTELFLLDLSIEHPTVDDMVRFAIGPNYAELTGAVMSPDGGTLFLNVMHPSYKNGAPYDRSMTVAITGFKKESHD